MVRYYKGREYVADYALYITQAPEVPNKYSYAA